MKLYTEKLNTFIRNSTDLFYFVNGYFFISRLDSTILVKIDESYIIVATKEL